MTARTLVLWNPASGRAEEASAVRQHLAELADVSVEETRGREHTCDLASEAFDRGFTHVIAAGGDGTVNAVVNGLMRNRRRPSLSILPIGTANDFAQTLAIPDDLATALQVATATDPRSIDVIEFETDTQHRWFANVAAGGNSDEVTRQLTDDFKKRWGPLCYLRGALDVVTDLKTFDATVTFDDGPPEEVSLWNVVIANGRTNAGHIEVAPRANPEDGQLDVVLIRDGDLLDLSSLVVKYVVSDFLESDLVTYRQARRVRFRASPQMRFSFDGEAIDEQPIEFRAVPAALAMTVGAQYTAEPPQGVLNS